MIERLIYAALKSGIQTLKEEPRILEDLFMKQYGLSKAEFDAIRAYFEAHPPSVVHGYAHAEHKFPLYAIVLESEGEVQSFIGEDAGMVLDEEDPDHGADIHSSVWEHSYGIHVYAEHPDVVLYYYEIAKSILLGAHDFFTKEGLFQIAYSGMDLAPDPRYVPEHLFLRRLGMKCQREFQRLDNTVARAFKVRGIHIDSSGSPSDGGGVLTLVKTFSPEGD